MLVDAAPLVLAHLLMRGGLSVSGVIWKGGGVIAGGGTAVGNVVAGGGTAVGNVFLYIFCHSCLAVFHRGRWTT